LYYTGREKRREYDDLMVRTFLLTLDIFLASILR
jgi:hypothetical protein